MDILNSRRLSGLSQEFIRVIDTVTEMALDTLQQNEREYRLAAAFDLLASTEYYNSVANKGWTYCDETPQMLIYPYTNTCPRCIGHNEFKYTKANKPKSGHIGMITSELLCHMLEYVLKRNGRNVEISKASEPIDAVIYDKDSQKVVIAEVKSAPMLTLPLAMECDRLTNNVDGDLAYVNHSLADNPSLKKSEIGIFIPAVSEELPEQFFPLEIQWETENKPFYKALLRLLNKETGFFDIYYKYWEKAFVAYSNKDKNISLFWLTNGCGQPDERRPMDWPNRRGKGFESVSDGKTSVGMDRTDDIKKAIYQVLKLGSKYKPNDSNIKTAVISNIHAVRHYDEYLFTVRDVIWTLNSSHSIIKAGQLDPETPIYNLFDGILSFTKSDIRDSWMKDLFDF